MTFLNSLHAAIRRNLHWLEQFVIAGGLTALLAQLFAAQPVYPMYWDTVILACVFFMLAFWPAPGYFVFLLAALYPLSSISIYVAVLVLAIGLIGQHWFIPNLGLLALILGTPFLNGVYLAWLPLLLGGLWWGPRAGLMAGLAASLWGKFLFGLAGLTPDWVQLPGLYPDVGFVLARFSGQSATQILQTTFQPLLPDSTAALYHLLQTGIWALVGWGVGRLALEDRVQYLRPRATIILLIGAAAASGALHVLLFLWLAAPEGVMPQSAWQGLLLNSLVVLMCAILLESLLYFFEHPWSIPLKSPTRTDTLLAAPLLRPLPDSDPQTDSAPVPAPSSPKPDSDESLIMIELD